MLSKYNCEVVLSLLIVFLYWLLFVSLDFMDTAHSIFTVLGIIQDDEKHIYIEFAFLVFVCMNVVMNSIIVIFL